MRYSGKARAKLILMGEHAVVYGYPAIAASIGLETRVTLVANGDRFQHFGGWRRLDGAAKRALKKAMSALGLMHRQIGFSVNSSIPVGQGLGSSAAFSVAFSRALLKLSGRADSWMAVKKISAMMESEFHTNPSGVDTAVSFRKGVFYFKKGKPLVRLKVVKPFYVGIVQTGSSPATRKMVEMVRRRYGEEPKIVSDLMASIGGLVKKARNYIVNSDLESLGRALNENQKLLAKLGVSTPVIDGLCREVLKAGAIGAKLTGGGGGGSVIFVVRSARFGRKVAKDIGLNERTIVIRIG